MAFLLSLWLLPRDAHATISCSPSTPGTSDFGTPSPLDAATTDVQSSFTITCNLTRADVGGPSGSNHTLYLCISYDNGTGGASAGGNRQLAGGANIATYDLYTASSYSGTHWGDRAGSPSGTVVEASVSFTKPTGTGNTPIGPLATLPITIYPRLFGGQTTLPPGIYSSTLTQTVESFLDSVPAGCGAGGTVSSTATASQPVTVNYQKECRVGTVSTLNFGSSGLLASNLDAATGVSVTCTSSTPYKIGLDAGTGSGATTASRRMTGASSPSTIGYSLYQDPARAQNWGNDTTGGTDTVNNVGAGTAASYSIYGRVPPQATPQPDSYQDTVVLSVVF